MIRVDACECRKFIGSKESDTWEQEVDLECKKWYVSTGGGFGM